MPGFGSSLKYLWDSIQVYYPKNRVLYPSQILSRDCLAAALQIKLSVFKRNLNKICFGKGQHLFQYLSVLKDVGRSNFSFACVKHWFNYAIITYTPFKNIAHICSFQAECYTGIQQKSNLRQLTGRNPILQCIKCTSGTFSSVLQCYKYLYKRYL